MEEKSVVSPQGRTYYWCARPEKPSRALVFLPGLTANHHLFDQQIPYFSPDYTVLVWDAPGHGKSRPYAPFSYTNQAEELKRILDAEQIQQAVLIGQSAGGFAAQSLLDKYPQRAAGFVAIDSCPYGREYYSKSDFFWLRQTKWMFHLYADSALRRVMAKMCCQGRSGQENMLAMLADYDYQELCDLAYLGFAGVVNEVRDINIPCPVCLLVGDHDHTGKVQSYNRAWHQQSGYPLHFIENAAHNANVDNPAQVNAIIADFLASL